GTFIINGTAAVVKGLVVSVRAGDLSVDLTLASGFGGVSTGTSTTSFEITGGGAVFSISPIVGLSGQESIGVNEVSTGQLGHLGDGNSNNYLGSLQTGLTNDLSSGNFATAQRIVRMAIDEVASLRGRLGGFQKDTLVTTINSLNVARENITAAESAIRDADFASETADLTRAQILVNAATQTLRIANTQTQNALALLS
ncbi:MAG: flagellin, partial [Planctomycetes bacterium]|nr:flagellin [Planctomycetota bacterium]